jgi:hypothetical protein
MPPLRARIDTLVTRHPTAPLALRAALASLAAWLIVLPFGGVADEYPYYAPLGAVVSVSTTVLSSIRTSVQIAVSLFLGACLATAAMLSPLPHLLALGFVVGVGTLLAGWRRLGSLGTWVPISAIFMLIIGHQDPSHFVPAYLGFTTFGAVVGTLVNLALPPLRFLPALRAQDDLREALVEQLDELADGLDQRPVPSRDDWHARRYELLPRALTVQQLVGDATGGPPVNWRVHRSQERADRVAEQGRALVNLAFLVAELASNLTGWEHSGNDHAPLGPELRPPTARALRELAAALRSIDVSVAEPDELARAWREAEALADSVREVRRRTGQDLFEAGTLVTGIERALLAVSP